MRERGPKKDDRKCVMYRKDRIFNSSVVGSFIW